MKKQQYLNLQVVLGVFLFSGAITTGSLAQESYQYQTRDDFREILDSAGVQGSVLVFDATARIFYSNDFDWCEKGFLPASTFKIPNTIIALETGIMESDSTVIPWDGQQRRMDAWERDLTLREAFHVSCVPCYQDIARNIGEDRMKEYLALLNYGGMNVDSSNIDAFWLEGDSHISQHEQVDFLYRFYYDLLPLSARTLQIMKNLMIIEETPSYRLSGKTGWSVREGRNNGWFVGYLEAGGRVYFFATNINPGSEFNLGLFLVIRRDITMKALRSLEIF